MQEIWKDIKGYEGYYQVSSFGNVRSLNRNVAQKDNKLQLKKGKILKPRINRDGYYTVVLCSEKQKKYSNVHRIVAETFLPNSDNLPCVNHKDENKLNNTVWINEDGTVDYEKSNLEWCNHSYNNTYGTRIIRASSKKCKPVLQYDLEGNFVKEWKSSIEIQNTLGFPKVSIRYCSQNRSKTAYGFIWKYKNDVK